MKRAGEAMIKATVERVAPEFFAQGHERVYVAACCGRVLVTTEEAKECRTCGGTPEGRWWEESEVVQKS